MKESELKKKFNELSFIPSKKMGQNFLHSNAHIDIIIKSLELKESDIVLEIGPGFGAITEKILKLNNNLFVIELDKRIAAFLKKNFSFKELINASVLDINLEEFCQKNFINKIISNLPYSIATNIIINSLQCKDVSVMIYMIQKELADRFFAKKNSKNYNSLSILIQNFFEIEKICEVGPSCFIPQPKVDSTVIKLIPKKKEINIFEFNLFLKKCFSSKRKKLINNLKNYYSRELINKIFFELNLNNNVRAEEIDVKTFEKFFLKVENEN